MKKKKENPIVEEQKHLFEIIKSKISNKTGLVYEIEDLLEVSGESVYRRIKGETLLDFAELIKICQRYNVSIDEMLNYKPNKSVLFEYKPVVISDNESYMAYMEHLLNTMDMVAKSPLEKELISAAQDVPFYHFYKYPDLAYFRLYVWNDTLFRNKMSFNQFCDLLDKNRIKSIYEQIYQTYISIPAREIWTENTIDATIRLIAYHFETGSFDSKDSVLFLLDRFSSLIDTMKQYADDGYKGNEKKIPFELHYCSVDLENNFMLMRKGEQMLCILQLYAINRITTDNELICTESKKWVDSMISKSILISGDGAFRERFLFFERAKEKIHELIKKAIA